MLIASFFNYINRVADALGVGRSRKNTECESQVNDEEEEASG